MNKNNNPSTKNSLEEISKLCDHLIKMDAHGKRTRDQLSAIVYAAQQLGINPFQALQGGINFIQGKIEISSRTMNALIRSQGHSIQKDPKSDNTICILHGKRKDNGDVWTASFSLKDAEIAGKDLTKGTWAQYPERMLFARALSILARELFPDVIGNCYVAGEIAEESTLCASNESPSQVPIITNEQSEELESLLSQVPEYKEKILQYLSYKKIETLAHLPVSLYPELIKKVKAKVETQLQQEEKQTEEKPIAETVVKEEEKENIN